MKSTEEGRSARKHREIIEAATAVFMKLGYEGTSMEQIAAKAGVSKQTVYKHFADKERLFSDIVLATTGQVDRVVALVAGPLAETRALKKDPRCWADNSSRRSWNPNFCDCGAS